MPLLDGCFFLFLYGALALFAEGPENTQSKKSLPYVRYAKCAFKLGEEEERSALWILYCSAVASEAHFTTSSNPF